MTERAHTVAIAIDEDDAERLVHILALWVADGEKIAASVIPNRLRQGVREANARDRSILERLERMLDM